MRQLPALYSDVKVCVTYHLQDVGTFEILRRGEIGAYRKIGAFTGTFPSRGYQEHEHLLKFHRATRW